MHSLDLRVHTLISDLLLPESSSPPPQHSMRWTSCVRVTWKAKVELTGTIVTSHGSSLLVTSQQ